MANAEHVKLLKQWAELWNRWRTENPKIVPDLRQAELNKVNLDGANLKGANLSGAYLSYASLREADLSGANLLGASLIGTSLKQAKIDRRTRIDAKWRLVWELVNLGGRGKDLRKVNLRGTNLSEADLHKANLSNADLSEADLSNADLSNADLSHAFLGGAMLFRTNLKGSNLKEANLTRADLEEANIQGANLKNAILLGVDLSRAHPNLVEEENSERIDAPVAHYLVVERDNSRQKFKLRHPLYSIGREAECDIRLPSKFISRRHATLVQLSREDNTYYRIIDGDPEGTPSANGILINGRKLSAIDLQHGDEIIFGPQIRAVYYQYSRVADTATASNNDSDKTAILPNLLGELDEKSTLRISFDLLEQVIDYLKAHGDDPAASKMRDRLQKYIDPKDLDPQDLDFQDIDSSQTEALDREFE